MMWYGNQMGLWGYVFMTVGTVLFWGLVILAIVALVRYLNRPSQRPASPVERSTPEQLLAERYARGEIDESEYQHRLEVLRGQPTQTTGS